MNRKVSYQLHIQPLFTAKQQACMLDQFDLKKYEDVRRWADKIASSLTKKTMPADETKPVAGRMDRVVSTLGRRGLRPLNLRLVGVRTVERIPQNRSARVSDSGERSHQCTASLPFIVGWKVRRWRYSPLLARGYRPDSDRNSPQQLDDFDLPG